VDKFGKFLEKLKPEASSNLKVVVLCVVTATTFWLLNALNKDDYTTIVRQPIALSFDQTEYMAVAPLPELVSIEINGNGWDLLRKYFKFKSTPFTIQIEDPSKNGYVLARTFQRELAENLAPTQLVSIIQDTITFRIDKIISRKVTIAPDTSENILSKNIRFGSRFSIDPQQVTVRGPISKIQDLEGIWKVDLGEQNINQNFSKLLPLTVPRNLRDYLTLNEESVLVAFDVIEFTEGERVLEVQKTFFPANVKTKPENETVKLSYLVEATKQEDVEKLDLKAVLNYNNRNREDSTVSVTLNRNPAYLEIISFDPPEFKLIYD
jgi:hypothetical protein